VDILHLIYNSSKHYCISNDSVDVEIRKLLIKAKQFGYTKKDFDTYQGLKIIIYTAKDEKDVKVKHYTRCRYLTFDLLNEISLCLDLGIPLKSLQTELE